MNWSYIIDDRLWHSIHIYRVTYEWYSSVRWKPRSYMGEEALSFGELLGIICIIAELITFMAGTIGFICTPDTDNGSDDE